MLYAVYAPGAKGARRIDRRGDTEQEERVMRQMHDYKGWRFGVTALEQDGRWSARIEVYRPGRPSREQSPMPLPFTTKAASREGILVLARKHAEGWIDRQELGRPSIEASDSGAQEHARRWAPGQTDQSPQ